MIRLIFRRGKLKKDKKLYSVFWMNSCCWTIFEIGSPLNSDPFCMNDPPALSYCQYQASALMLTPVTASAACSAPMTVILSWGNYPGMFPPSPGASDMPHLPPPIARCQQEMVGDQQIGIGAKTERKVFCLLDFGLRQKLKKCGRVFVQLILRLRSWSCSLKTISFLFVRRSLTYTFI